MDTSCSPIDSLTKIITIKNSVMSMNNNPIKDKKFRIFIQLMPISTRVCTVSVINNYFYDFDYNPSSILELVLVGIGEVQEIGNVFVSKFEFHLV